MTYFGLAFFWSIEIVKVFRKVVLCSLNRVQQDRIGYPCEKIEQFEIFKMAAGGHLEFQLFAAKKLKKVKS